MMYLIMPHNTKCGQRANLSVKNKLTLFLLEGKEIRKYQALPNPNEGWTNYILAVIEQHCSPMNLNLKALSNGPKRIPKTLIKPTLLKNMIQRLRAIPNKVDSIIIANYLPV